MHDRELYARSFADVYDDWYSNLHDVGAVVQAFADRLPSGSTIIELGSGSGRLADPLARSGFVTLALDSALSMIGQDKSMSLRVAADMTAIPFAPGCCDGALIAYNTLLTLAGTELQRRCLSQASSLLRSGAVLAIESFIGPSDDPADPAEAEDTEDTEAPAEEEDRADTGAQGSPDQTFGLSLSNHHRNDDARLAILTWSETDATDTSETADTIVTGAHIELGPEGSRTRPWQLCYKAPSQIDELASEAGFELDLRCADWAGTPLGSQDVRHVSWYRRK